jgi:hypothetical protein
VIWRTRTTYFCRWCRLRPRFVLSHLSEGKEI